MNLQIPEITPSPSSPIEPQVSVTKRIIAPSVLKGYSSSVISPFVDFWLLGGASILVWALMVTGELFRDRIEPIDNHFMQLGAFFSMMSIFCNHPHFMISYRFGYGRGRKFVFDNWFSLILVPTSLIAVYTFAYFKFDTQISELAAVIFLNQVFEKLGLGFRLGTLANLGTEVLSHSALLMFLTVGWHYAKQVFGCMMVYAKYDNYPISRFQKSLIKASVFSIAFFNFFYMSIYAPEFSSGAASQSYFYNIPLVSFGLPKLLIPLSAAWVIVLSSATLYCVCYRNYRLHHRKPSANFLISWVALHIWWMPFIRQKEYYLLAAPFFHGLQYLPFAYRLEVSKLKNLNPLYIRISLRIALLLFIGFSAFELIASLLDKYFETLWYTRTLFFFVAFSVFINIHHFFIDSVVWKFNQSEIRDGLFLKSDTDTDID